jgi:hypothetical protein
MQRCAQLFPHTSLKTETAGLYKCRVVSYREGAPGSGAWKRKKCAENRIMNMFNTFRNLVFMLSIPAFWGGARR